MKTIKGDIFEIWKSGEYNVFIHGANCFNTMGSGVAAGVKKHLPDLYEADQKTKPGNIFKLGSYSYFIYPKHKLAFNAYTQYGTLSDTDRRPAEYSAMIESFDRINNASKKYLDSRHMTAKFIMPMIGCGLGGANWGLVSEIIDRVFGDNATVCIFER